MCARPPYGVSSVLRFDIVRGVSKFGIAECHLIFFNMIGAIGFNDSILCIIKENVEVFSLGSAI